MSPITIRVAELRAARGWTQGELAKQARISRATVNRIESASNRRVDFTVLERLAKALGVAPGLLIVQDDSAERDDARPKAAKKRGRK